MLHVISTIVLVILALGIVNRRRRDLHIKLMSSAFVIDVSLVLYIELTRRAVETVVGGSKILVWVHAAISLTVLVLYVVQIQMGRKVLATTTTEPSMAMAGGPHPSQESHSHSAAHSRKLHRKLGMSFVVFRLLNYVTAFML